MNNGYWGKILRVNLTNKTVKEEELPEQRYRQYLGGVGLAARYIAEEVPMDCDPLGPENELIFSVGPYNMINGAGAGRWSVCAISPKTGLWGEANGGGFFGNNFKRSGYDMLIVEGASETPVYLHIENDHAELRDATKYWGMDTIETSEAVYEDYGTNKVSVICIGQAGERLVPMACICSEASHGHAGRTGMGAVMGSKKLKAVVVKGTKPMSVYDEAKVKEVVTKIRNGILNSPSMPSFKINGQAGAIIPREATGLLPMKNWLLGSWAEGAEKLGTPNFNEVLNVTTRACAYCPCGCKRYVKVTDAGEYNHEGPGAEYETLAMLGSALLIDDVVKVSYGNDLCNRYGIDTMSAGGVIAMMFELYEKGVIDKDFLEGIDAKWGSGEAMCQLVRKIGLAETPLGRALGGGVKPMAELIGGELADEAAVHTRNLEVAAHDPRAYFSMAVSYATGSRGACHLHGFSEMMELGTTIPQIGADVTADRHSNEHKGKAAAIYQDLAQIHNSFVWCFCAPISYELQVEALHAITGWDDVTEENFIIAGTRINTLQHLINLKRGLKPEDIKMPKRFYRPVNEGTCAGKVPDFAKMIADYYEFRDWDPKTAMPSAAKLKELDLEWFA